MNLKRKPTKKATAQRIARRVVYAAARESAKAKVASATTAFGSVEQSTADWRHSHYYGVARGALELAENLGVFTWETAAHVRERIGKMDEAARRRWEKLHQQKYAHLHEPTTEKS